MRSITTLKFATKYCFCIFLLHSTSSSASAQNHWLDTIPQLQVGCIADQGKIESIDFGKSLRNNGKDAGATETGLPFLTKASPTGNVDGSVAWEACSIYKGAARSTDRFQLRALPASAGAFSLCEGTDVKACSGALIAWIKTKVPDFNTPTRVIPLFEYSAEKLDATKQSVSDLIMQTFLIKGDDTPSKVPDPVTDLDQQLYGQPTQPRQPRHLLTSQFPPPPDITKKGGEKSYTGVLVFVPVSDEQKTLLGVP